MRILIVEDSEPVRRRLLASLAALEGVEVVGCASGEAEALSRLAASGADVAIVDIQLKEGNGMNVLREAKRRYQGLKVMMLSNYAFPQYRGRCLELGADCFLDKSTEFMAVECVIAGWARAATPDESEAEDR